jgi:hypothetical protein
MKFKHFSSTVALLALLAAPLSQAKILDVYDQPKDNAKITGKIDTEVGIVPIYTPKGSAWIKVANPANGDVGWIKQASLETPGAMTSSFSFSQQVSNNHGKGPQTFIIQYGTPKQLPPDQAQRMLKQIQDNQAAIQHSMQKVMDNIFQNMHQQEWGNYPIVMPVVILPQKLLPNQSSVTNDTLQKTKAVKSTKNVPSEETDHEADEQE